MLNLPFRNVALAKELILSMNSICDKPVKIMEVCGSHTMAIRKDALASLFPENIKLISGPGCPVCVTPLSFIDKITALAHNENFIIASFGDLSRVPGSSQTLSQVSSGKADVRYIYSPLEILELARENKNKNIIFPAIGFETTAPLIASMLEDSLNEGLKNLFILSGLKTMPAVLEKIASDPQSQVDAFLLPGNVSSVTGIKPYDFLPVKYSLPCVICGFEPLDIIQSVFMILLQTKNKKPQVENEYRRIVSTEGNINSQKLIKKYFQSSDSQWRGLGKIEDSALVLKNEYAFLDAEQFIPNFPEIEEKHTGCICAKILKGISTPADCKLFSKKCTPDSPVGACMVSAEGTCNIWFKYPDENK